MHKKLLAALILTGLLIPAVFVIARAQSGIPSYYMAHYNHATQVLQQEYPSFLTAFQALQEEIKTIDSSNKQGQLDALMRFFPFIENLAHMDASVSDTYENGVKWDLPTEVVVSYFAMNLPTADNHATSVNDLIFDAFETSLASGDAVGILPLNTLMQKHNLNRQEAQQIQTALHRLYPSHSLI